MSILTWNTLLNPIRRKDIHGSHETLDTGINRTEIERDYDRILFSTPLRRLANKTQVFPLEEHDSIRTRLTHSYEVSNLARSIGIKLAFEHAEHVFGAQHEELQVKRNIPALLAAVGLAHDLGNPPFGHQGEIAIQEWFKGKFSNQKISSDFLNFDGNAQTFRLLTRLQLLNDEFGLNLTVATLAGLVKYPSIYGSENKGGFKKYGIFRSESRIIQEVWQETGLAEGIRHPLAYVMEACDDIAYSIIDAEDIVKKGYASFYDLIDHLSTYSSDLAIDEVIHSAQQKNEEFKREKLSSKELNDISMQIFRVKAISIMIKSATDVFVDNIEKILNGNIAKGFELIESSGAAQLCSAAQEFDERYGFRHKAVLQLELQGNNYIKSSMDLFWEAIQPDNGPCTPFEKYAYGRISENYRRIYENSSKTLEDKCQLLCDVISGMTEAYLIKTHNELKSLKHA